MHAAFVDFSKAFDSVNHWEVLEARGIHPKLISLIKDLYEGNRVQVAGQGRVQSEWFCIRTGVRQGCPLSPLLFRSLKANLFSSRRVGLGAKLKL